MLLYVDHSKIILKVFNLKLIMITVKKQKFKSLLQTFLNLNWTQKILH
jgi:hypothetical protein